MCPAACSSGLTSAVQDGGWGRSVHRPLATLEENLVQRGAQSVVQPLPSPGREWNDWEMALKGTGVGGVFTGLPESPAPSSCIQSVTRGTFPLPTGDCGGQGSQASACVLSRFSCARLFVILWTVAARLLCRWDSPGKNTGVGCHALLQGIFPNPEIKPTSVMPPALSSLPPVPPGKPPGPGVDPCEGWGGCWGCPGYRYMSKHLWV